ncbi:hypothetical protein DOM22_02860 [Bdellovibrio sp. ZAP7]|uniref:hypothetical protein n=1 Tax=Bdellovibrio sp. ZAP7 TaxID=2231053 RepID=UPI00115907EF|nr:hypothetical protein [Bdellovibrio sp. ZAP7]QDK44165.1 hypothetical protein DOM22_02860 [Bdellovibrio sp. ZAP7]
MKQSIRNLIIFSMLFGVSVTGHAQSVTPLATTEVIPTTAASPVVTATSTTTTTTTTSTQTVFDVFYAQMAAEQAAIAKQAEAEAEAQANAQKLAAGMQLAFKYCPFLQESNAQKARKGIADIGKKAAEQADDAKSKDPSISQNGKQEIAQDKQSADLGKACEIFMKDGGETGSAGAVVLAEVRENKSAFDGKRLKDIAKLCPNYSKMSEEKKNLFWVWTMMSIAKVESSCDPGAENKDAPHGTAYGLFQLGKDQCDGADLKDKVENTKCAVRKLASELAERKTLIASTATGKNGNTNWAAICEGNAKECGRNGDSVQKTKALISQFGACGGRVSSNDDNSAKGEEKAEAKPKGKRSPSGKPQKPQKKAIEPQVT